MTRKQLAVVVVTAMCVGGIATIAHADPVVVDVALDTSALMASPAGPFALNFQLIDGGGEATSTATLYDFRFGSGGAVGDATTIGGASGDLFSIITLTDFGGSFFNQFTQGFNAGPLLRFSILLNGGTEPGGIPDQLSMAILDGTGFGTPTEFFDAFFTIDMDSEHPVISTFASDPSSGLGIGSPNVNVVPEPSTIMLACAGVLVGLFRKSRIKNQESKIHR